MEETKRYRKSEFNDLPAVRQNYQFPKEVYIVDSTIRTLQSGASGGYHTLKDLVEIGKALDGLGIREIIVQLSWQDGPKICEGLAQENLKCKIVGTFRAYHPFWEKLTDQGIQAGVDEICFESIIDSNHFDRAAELCHKKGKKISHAFSDIYSYPQVVELCKKGVECGCQSQSFHDSFSLFRFGINPDAIKYFVTSLRHDVPDLPPVYVHFSNIFGHAAMTAAAAIVAGASAPDVCMNGIGHHSGHIPLEEIVMVLECLYGIKTGIKLEKLKEVSRFIQDRTGIPVPLMKPIVGDYTFLVDGYYHADEINVPEDKKLHSIFPFSPPLVGSEEKIIWSHRQITPESVRWKLSSIGLEYQDRHVEQIIVQVTETLLRKKLYPNWLTDSQFEEICRSTLQK